MVHIVEKRKGLRIKKDPVAKAKLPGVCAAVSGCLVLVAGISLAVLGRSAVRDDNIHITRLVQAFGPILCIVGLALLVGGFTYKYIVHRRKKRVRLQRQKYELRSRSPGDGSSLGALDVDLLRHMEELGLEIGEPSSQDFADLYVISSHNMTQGDPQHQPPGSRTLRSMKTTDGSKIKHSRSSAEPNIISSFQLESSYPDSLSESTASIKSTSKLIGKKSPESKKSNSKAKKSFNISGIDTARPVEPNELNEENGPSLRRPDGHLSPTIIIEGPHPDNMTPSAVSQSQNPKNIMEDNNNGGSGEEVSVMEMQWRSMASGFSNKLGRQETLALHQDAEVEDIPDTSLQHGVLMDVHKLDTILQEPDTADF